MGANEVRIGKRVNSILSKVKNNRPISSMIYANNWKEKSYFELANDSINILVLYFLHRPQMVDLAVGVLCLLEDEIFFPL